MVVVCSRVVSYIKPFEQRIEVVLFIDVIVSLKRAEEQALAEPARTDEEQKVPSQFHLLEIHGLVDQIKTLLLYLLEVADAVGNTLEVVAHNRFLFVLANIHH